jgi:CubicO group peptidase (beta-lactamase class C family)
LTEQLHWARVPGISIARVTRESVDPAQAGVLLAGSGQRVEAETIFEAASLSKPVFAYAVFQQLVVPGTLDLDRPLDAYLPAPYPSADARTAKITARHVLTHTCGLPNWRHAIGEPLTLAFDPGTQYRYSGEGFYFLQTVVERLAGLGFDAFMRIALDELGMPASDYVWRASYAGLGARPHDARGRPLPWDSALLGAALRAVAQRDGTAFEAWSTRQALAALAQTVPPRAPLPWNAMPNAAWSLFTTARDYAAFVRRLLRSPDHPMLVAAVQTSPYVWRGLGVAIQVRGERRSFFHTGANPGFKAVMFGDLQNGRGIVSFTNGDGGFPENMYVVESALGPQPAISDLEQP